MPDSSVYDHLAKAVEHIHKAAAASDCSVCKSMIGEEAEHLDLKVDLMHKTERIAETGPEMEAANDRADEMLGKEPMVRPAGGDDGEDERGGPLGLLPSGGLGLGLREMIQNRPRLADMNPFGGPRSRRGRERGGE